MRDTGQGTVCRDHIQQGTMSTLCAGDSLVCRSPSLPDLPPLALGLCPSHRDVLQMRQKMKAEEEERLRIENINRLRREALALASEPPKPKKKTPPGNRPTTAP